MLDDELAFVVKNKIVYVKIKYTQNKNMYLKVKGNDIVVFAPRKLKESVIRSFVLEHIEKFSDYVEKNVANKIFSIKEKFIFIDGQKYDIFVLTGFKKKSLQFAGKKIYVKSLTGEDTEIVDILNKYLKERLTTYLQTALNKWKLRLNILKPIDFKVSYKTTAWGTNYIQKDYITFSLKLAHFDSSVIDYVIVHELAHCFHPDHSKSFWEFVEFHYPNFETQKKILKNSKILNED